MTNPVLTHPADAGLATDSESWLALMDVIGNKAGYFQPLGSAHWAYFVSGGTTLLVTFEQIDRIRAHDDQMPLGHTIAQAHGWSHLCVIANGETWYRDPAVYRYFDRLVDDAFFEDYDRIVFYGAGTAGHAATAFSVTAPGATVVAISPRATMDPAQAGWDHRSPAARRLDFATRYGYAPDMIDGTGAVVTIHDPLVREDAMHAALFRADHVTSLRTPHLSDRVEWALAHMAILPKLIAAAASGPVTAAQFATLWRARRDFGPYLRTLLVRAERSGHPLREMAICRSVNARLQAPRFRKRLAELQASSGDK